MQHRQSDPSRLSAGNDNEQPEQTRVPRCSNCGKPASREFRPFCSARCKDVDLSRWLHGTYAIPGGNVDEDEDGDEVPSPPTDN